MSFALRLCLGMLNNVHRIITAFEVREALFESVGRQHSSFHLFHRFKRCVMRDLHRLRHDAHVATH
jgi:hypothetical protein